MKKKVTGTVRVDSYRVMIEAVDAGVLYGWNRAHKHTDSPSEDAIKEAIYSAVMSEICERFSFTPEDE